MKTKTILVTGANGQLGNEIKIIAQKSATNFIFTDAKQLDITNKKVVKAFFSQYKPDYCINCAAYTAVDLAEEEREKAYAINVLGTQYLAEEAKKHNTTLIHISTDFVFDGAKNTPYTEEDIPNPINYYGETKYLGEQFVQKNVENYYIVRTSWLYGSKGNNFVKTMLRLSETNEELKIVNNQFGSPTYAKDLALFVLSLIKTKNSFGIYHFSNSGATNWAAFAEKIIYLTKKNTKIKGIPDVEYPTKARRPRFSVMNLDKAKNTSLVIRNWEEALKEYIAKGL